MNKQNKIVIKEHKSNMNKQNKIVIIVIALALILTVGYAMFSESINIGGTASATGDFAIIFENTGTIKESGSIGTTADISLDKKKLSIVVPKLEYPGSYAEIPVTIKNTGSITAILKGIEVSGLMNDDITVSYSGVLKDEQLATNETKEMKIKVMWNKSSTTTSSNLSFTIGLNYEQAINHITTNPSGPTILASGKVGDNVTYNYQDDGVLSVAGSGPMWNGGCNLHSDMICNNPYTSILGESFIIIAKEQGLDLSTKEGIKTRQDMLGAFLSQNFADVGLTEAVFINVLKSELGFSDEEVNKILNVYSSTPKINNVKIGNQITHIGEGAFLNIKASNVVIPNSVITFGDSSFSQSRIGTFTFGNTDSITVNGNSLFDGATINNFIIPEGVKTIDNSIFSQCLGFATITIPSTVTSIGDSIFYGATDLKTIVNKTGKSFDWTKIIGGGTGTPFETGSHGDINIIK